MIAQLNDHWRVIDDPLQWILQVRRGQASTKASGWSGAHYCRQRISLLQCIRENCGEVDPEALTIIMTLPNWHPDREETYTPMAAG